MSFDPKAPLTVLAKESNELNAVLKKAMLLARIEAVLMPLLPKTLAKHCQVANAINDTITILVNSGSNATELRFLSEGLCQQFKSLPELSPYATLLIKVRPPLAPSQKRQQQAVVRRPACPPSEDSLEAIKEAAEGISDERLRKALLRFL